MREKVFEVDISRNADGRRLSWPSRSECGDEAALGGNQQYHDLRNRTWVDVEHALEQEARALARLMSGEVSEEELREEFYAEGDRSGEAPLEGMDPGVAAAAIALSASGAITAYSCNGGAFGCLHNSHHPVVSFYARRKILPLLARCAERSDVGLENIPEGMLNAYADRVGAMHAFAKELFEARSEFDALKSKSRKA